MRIKTMTAVFGRLNGERLELSPGFNLLHAPNEGGKSTWCAFLRAMLYGIDTRDRDKKGHLADKNRYQPWSGAPMEGELTLEWQGRDITLRRGPRGSTPFGAFSAVYTGTEEPVPGLTADSCGELLVGAGREVFERSAFIGQGGALTITSAPELERRIAALVSSGEEDVSYSQTEKRLKDWLNRRRVNKSVGRIPQLEEELAREREACRQAQALNGEINALEGERAALDRRREDLARELEVHKALARRELDRRFCRAKADLAQAQAQLDALARERGRFGLLPEKEELKRAQGELAFLKTLDPEIKQGEEALAQAEEAYVQANIAIQDDPHFNGMTGEEARRKAESDRREHGERLARAAGKRRLFWVLQLIGLAAGAGLALAGVWRGLPGGPLLGLAGYGLCAVLSLVFLSGGRRLEGAAAQLLARYGADDPQGLDALAEDYAARWRRADEAAQALKTVRGGLNDRKARRENSRADLFQFVHGFAPEVKDLFGCSAALSLALNLGEREAVAQARLEGARGLYEALRAQGGRDPGEEPPLEAPARTLEETAAQLGTAQAELERLDRTLNMALGRQKSGGDPTVLAARVEALEGELERRQGEQEAISIAMEALKEANALLQERFSPALNRRAGELLARLTGGRYTALSLDRELEASAAGAGDVLPRRALFLSKGTVDQVYLAVRLAVYALCLEGRQVPLVLDDALAAFDDGRMALALDLLLELAGETQILFFTCQAREGDYLAARPDVARIALPG